MRRPQLNGRWSRLRGHILLFWLQGMRHEFEAFSHLLTRLLDSPEFDAAALVGADTHSGSSPWSASNRACSLLLQRKSGYLAAFQGRWVLTAPLAARALQETGTPIAYIG